MRDGFSRCHPVLLALFYGMVLGVTMFYMHPVFTGISGGAATAYLVYRRGWRGLIRVCLLALPVVVLAAVINPMFSHAGVTILGYLPTGNPLTLESMVYGVCAGATMWVVFVWFATFHQVMTRDKMVYLLGKGFPAVSLLVSMVLRFLPVFRGRMEQVEAAQRCMGRNVSGGSWWWKLKQGVRVLSITVTWTLEHGMDTADSMRARGYGLRGRTMYHTYRWDGRCVAMAVGMCLCLGVVVVGVVSGQLDVRFYPVWRINGGSWYAWVCYGAYGLLCVLPVGLNVAGDWKWRSWMCKM